MRTSQTLVEGAKLILGVGTVGLRTPRYLAPILVRMIVLIVRTKDLDKRIQPISLLSKPAVVRGLIEEGSL